MKATNQRLCKYQMFITGSGNADHFRALFQRALAELKYLGLVKASRKKTDHVSKIMWKGL